MYKNLDTTAWVRAPKKRDTVTSHNIQRKTAYNTHATRTYRTRIEVRSGFFEQHARGGEAPSCGFQGARCSYRGCGCDVATMRKNGPDAITHRRP